MNSSKEIMSVAEFRKILLAIDNCQEQVVSKLEDGSTDYDEKCNMQVMCDKCIDRLAGMLEWAEDFEEERKGKDILS